MEKNKGLRALEQYFNEQDETKKKASEADLKKYIRSVMEYLMDSNDTENMEMLEQKGFFGSIEPGIFLKYAREQGRTEALLWLLHLKNRKYGYKDKDFRL